MFHRAESNHLQDGNMASAASGKLTLDSCFALSKRGLEEISNKHTFCFKRSGSLLPQIHFKKCKKSAAFEQRLLVIDRDGEHFARG